MSVPLNCPLCHSDHTFLLPVTRHVYGSSHNNRAFYSCKNCDVIFQYPNLSDVELSKFYRDEFEGFMNMRSDTSNTWTNAAAHCQANANQYLRRLPFFSNLLTDNCRVLEYGCSSGFMLYPLLEQNHEVHGIEPSGYFSDYSSSNGVYIHDPDLDFFTSYSNYFDLILHFFVFEHVVDPFDFLEKQLNLLKPGGSILFEVPCSSDALFRVFDIPEFERFYFSIAHPWYFNKSSLKYLLNRLGFEYKLYPHQRYDFSNHFVWALNRKPGGMSRYASSFSDNFNQLYKKELEESGFCDTYFVEILKS